MIVGRIAVVAIVAVIRTIIETIDIAIVVGIGFDLGNDIHANRAIIIEFDFDCLTRHQHAVDFDFGGVDLERASADHDDQHAVFAFRHRLDFTFDLGFAVAVIVIEFDRARHPLARICRVDKNFDFAVNFDTFIDARIGDIDGLTRDRHHAIGIRR